MVEGVTGVDYSESAYKIIGYESYKQTYWPDSLLLWQLELADNLTRDRTSLKGALMSADQAYRDINNDRLSPWQGEEEVRLAWVAALRSATGKALKAERFREDSSYNHVIIEFKSPGLFKGSKESPAFIEATEDRLKKYIKRAAKRERLSEEDFIGIAIDGDHVCFCQMRDGVIRSEHLLPFSPLSVELVVQAISSEHRKEISAQRLMTDFGHGSQNAKALMQSLSDALVSKLASGGNSKVKMLFEEWRTLYGQVADMSIEATEAIEKELSFRWHGDVKYSMSGRLFVIHTYNSMLIKLLAAEIVSGHNLSDIHQPAQAMAAISDDQALVQRMRFDIEDSGIFKSRMPGFVEEVMFSWYLDVVDVPDHGAAVLSSLRRILTSLSLYRSDRMTHSRDVLRDLYQGLVPGRLRQSLGEFYTPDWLVDHTVSRAKQGSWLDKRILDPTCGSGSFLIAAIRVIRREAERAGWDAATTLDRIVEAVWGFDLNPLAVQTARVNYLMEVADLLRNTPGHEIEIPVLMADAIYSPAHHPGDEDDVITYRIGSQTARLNIALPAALAGDRQRLDHFFDQMGADVEAGRDFDACYIRIIAAGVATDDEMRQWQGPLRYTYDQVLKLHQQSWDGIWFRIVRNFFWSSTAGRFDVIVGNPPWVRWSKLPAAYRERVKPTCEHYGIFSKTKRHGGNELDISAMITYTTADKWLADDGRLTFVITGTVFRNPSSAGFRTFKINPTDPDTMHLVPRLVDDMGGIKPFADAANHTTVVVFDKGDTPGKYPIPYAEWHAAEGSKRVIPVELNLEDVMRRVQIIEKEAAPVGDEGSPWSVLESGRSEVLQSLAGQCGWVAGRKGITADLNGVFFVTPNRSTPETVEVTSQPHAGRKDIGAARTAWVENTLLYPLVKGAGDFEAFYLRLDAPDAQRSLTFVPNKAINFPDYDAADIFMRRPDMKKTRAWFANYEGILRERSTFRRQMRGAPYFAIYNVGDYTFQNWKVIWPEMATRFYAAVASTAKVPGAGNKPYVPDHKIYFASFDEPQPAYFLCAMLNAPLVREWIESHVVKLQIGNVFKHTRLPEFDWTNSDHLAIADLTAGAHAEHDADARRQIIRQIEALTDTVLDLWAQR